MFIAEETRLDFIQNFLQSALEQCRNQQGLLGILVEFIFRIQLQHLRNASLGNDGQAKETCLNAPIECLIAAQAQATVIAV